MKITFELDGQDPITLPLIDGTATLGLDVVGVIISVKDQDNNNVPLNGHIITQSQHMVKTNNMTLTVSVERWFILINHVFQFDIPRGTIITNIQQEGHHWRFVYQNKERTTYYGWAIAKETPENRNLATRYWKLSDALEAIETEKNILLKNIEKAEQYELDEKSDG